MSKKVKDPDAEAKRILTEMIVAEPLSKVARRIGVNKGLIPYVLAGGHSPTVLKALNLPVLEREVVEACPECGKVHDMHKTCKTKKRRRIRFRKIVELDSQEELDMLDNIAWNNGFGTWGELCRHVAKRCVYGSMVNLYFDD